MGGENSKENTENKDANPDEQQEERQRLDPGQHAKVKLEQIYFDKYVYMNNRYSKGSMTKVRKR